MGTFTGLDLQGTTSFFVVGVETPKYANNCLQDYPNNVCQSALKTLHFVCVWGGDTLR